MVEKIFVPCAKVVQARLSIRRKNEPVFLTFTVAHCQYFTPPAIFRQLHRFGPSELFLSFTFKIPGKRMIIKITKQIIFVNVMITRIKITIMLNDRHTATVYFKDT